MSPLEQAPRFEDVPDFGMNAFGMSEAFDINAAFQEAVIGVASDLELELEEKMRRMEVIVHEGTSEIYRDFVDFRQMAAQMQMMCNHDHAFNRSMQENELLSSFMDGHKTNDGHDHDKDSQGRHKDEEEYEIDPKTGKKTKRKKKRGWFQAR